MKVVFFICIFLSLSQVLKCEESVTEVGEAKESSVKWLVAQIKQDTRKVLREIINFFLLPVLWIYDSLAFTKLLAEKTYSTYKLSTDFDAFIVTLHAQSAPVIINLFSEIHRGMKAARAEFNKLLRKAVIESNSFIQLFWNFLRIPIHFIRHAIKHLLKH